MTMDIAPNLGTQLEPASPVLTRPRVQILGEMHQRECPLYPLELRAAEILSLIGEGSLPQKERARLISQTGSYSCRQRPTLPHTFACSTIGPAGLNFRVRDGNGWIPRGMITDKSEQRRGRWPSVVGQDRAASL